MPTWEAATAAADRVAGDSRAADGAVAPGPGHSRVADSHQVAFALVVRSSSRCFGARSLARGVSVKCQRVRRRSRPCLVEGSGGLKQTFAGAVASSDREGGLQLATTLSSNWVEAEATDGTTANTRRSTQTSERVRPYRTVAVTSSYLGTSALLGTTSDYITRFKDKGSQNTTLTKQPQHLPTPVSCRWCREGSTHSYLTWTDAVVLHRRLDNSLQAELSGPAGVPERVSIDGSSIVCLATKRCHLTK